MTSLITQAIEAFKAAKFDFDKSINMQQEVIGLVVYRGNNPVNGWWPVKPSHIDGHVVLELDDRYEHLTIDECVKYIKKLNKK